MEVAMWRSILVPSVGILEVMIRGTIIYLGLLFLLRVFRREAGAIGIADLLLIVLIADAASNAMGGGYESVTEGLVLVGTIVGWNFILDWLSLKYPFVRRLIRPTPSMLIHDGHVLEHNLRRNLITREELFSLLRQQGIENPIEVEKCQLEGDGRISVIRFPRHAKHHASTGTF